MKCTIPFETKLNFKEQVKEICSISLEHELTKNNEEILGNFIINGTYKKHELSINKEDFEFVVPFQVDLERKIDLDTLEFTIDNFTYDYNNDEMDVKIDYIIEAEEIKEEENMERKEEFLDVNPLDLIEIPKDVPLNEDNEESNVIVDKPVKEMELDDDYMIYHIHIVKKEETLDNLIVKYNITKDEILNINNITSIKENDKLLIPLNNE